MAFHIINNNKWGEDAAKTKAKNAIEAIITDLKYYNENYVIGGTKSNVKEATANDVQKTMFGGWFHKYNYVDQVWCDGMYMGPALLAQLINYKNATNNVSNDDWSLLTKQFSITWEQLRDSKTGLLYHGMTATPTITDWSKDATPTSYHSGAFWGRANAWYMLALVDVLEVMPPSNTNYSVLKGYLEKLAASIASYQNEDGTWYQVLDQKDNALDGNYEESSCSALFTAAYLKALRLKLLESIKYETMAKKAYVALVNKFMAYDKNDNNKIQILGSCCSAGLGTNSNSLRDGSRSYYINGNDSKAVTGENTGYYYTEGKVLGGFIMAATEYERAYQNQDSKQILFAKDLAPNYDFSTTEGKLDATAYGDGTITYQWYKDGNAIANAKSATYAPTENGSYYCIATAATNSRSAGNNTIQTSTTKVTTANTDNGSTDNNGGSENGTTGNKLFDYTVPAGITLNTTETSVSPYGSVSASDEATTVKNGFKFVGSKTYLKITLANNTTLQVGDVITITSYAEKTGMGVKASAVDGGDAVNFASSTVANDFTTSSYTVKSDDVLNGKYCIYLYRSAGRTTYLKSITITRAVKKYKVSATAGAAGGSVSIKNGSGTTVNSGSEVEENTSLTFTATPSEGYEFVNWTDANNNSVSTEATYTTTVTAAIALTANFKAKTPVTPTEGEVIYDFTSSVGTTTDGISCTTANNVITFSSNFSAKDGKYITISPKTGGFKAGDVITLNGYCNSKNLSGVIIYSDVNGSSIFKSNILATSAAGGSEFTYTIEKDCDALYLGRYGGGTTCLTSLQVERPASSSNKTRLTASFERNADVVVNTTKTATLPTLTVKAGENILAADQYTVVYTSNAENVATLSDNTITIKSLGIATITATVTPKDANTYEGTTATYQLSVKAPSPLNVSVMDVTINTTDTEEEQPVIKVYGDNDKLLKLGQDYTLSYAVSGNNVTVDETGKFSVKKNAENTEFIKGTSLITVTATPTTSLGSNYIAGTLQFSYSVSEGKIKPVFSESFKDITINLQPGKSKTIAVPLIYNGEDVSSYFTYTYTIDPAISGLTVDGSKLTFTTPSATRTYTVKVNADAATIGDVNYGDVYDKPAEISFTLNVDSKYQTISVIPDSTSIQMYAGTTHEAPDLTVKNGNATLADTEYKVTWFSTSPGVVKVDATTGKIEAVSEGTAKIRVVVTGDNLESTTALITVEVDDPAMYRVKGSGETYKNHTRMWNQDKNMSVVLGGWLFSDDVKEIVETPNTSSEGLSAKYHWGPGATKAKWKLTGFDYYVAGDNNKNARQENGSNALPETTKIYNAYFADKGTIKDNMFNVPCSGSFLEFNPVTNGKVTVHIFQNGVFDAKTTKEADGTTKKEYQYRPQRRVFVMDEAGNFVESTAHIESTNGKPTGGIQTIDKYTWDLDNKTLTIKDVRSHFKGIPTTFDMTADGFKNNVYESLLDTQKVPNAAANDRKGSHGWCVLADSPVTYTFNVKAGKTYYLYNFGSKIGFYGFSFDEDETKPIVDVKDYDAETANANNVVEKTLDGHVAQVKITRKMVANRWTTCVLPFSLNRQQVDAIFGPAYSATAKEGTQILYFDHIEGNKAYFVRHAYNTIVAGKPFLIKPTKEVTSINTADVKAYPYVTIENTEPAKWCESNGYVWTSSYNTMNIAKNDYFIGASDGKFKAYSANSGTVKGFRGFLKANLPAGAKPVMLSISTSSITDGNDGETTGIEDLIITADGELMPANSRVYNINGQLVSEDASNFQSLPSGIYIINGKKYIK
ncbi:MAG: glycoside hydrolase family 88 protein [Prevotella sp.]|nr:glycoside hydrolase family 88 protein [Prevotella sp.]